MAGGYSEKLLDEIIALYRKESAQSAASPEVNIELEIRFRNTTREIFDDLYRAIRASEEFANPRLECSINIIPNITHTRDIREEKPQKIHKILVVAGKHAGDTYACKTRLLRPLEINDHMKYSVGIAREETRESIISSPSDLMRFKARVSFDYVGIAIGEKTPRAPRWRFDLTVIKSGVFRDLQNNLRDIREKFFPAKLTPANFLETIDYEYVTGYEVEIEYIGEPNDLTAIDIDIAKRVLLLINPTYTAELGYQDEIYHLAGYMVPADVLPKYKNPQHRLKSLGNQVIALDKNTYYDTLYPPDGYYVTDKADGQRAIVSIRGDVLRLVMSDSIVEFKIGGPGAASAGAPATIAPTEVTIVDSEVIRDDPKAAPVVYLFDVMVDRDENLVNEPFDTRIEHLASAAENINRFTGIRAIVKKYVKLSADNLQEGFDIVWKAEHPYETDGLIITEPSAGYLKTRNWKWKPFDHTTIDLLAMRCPSTLLGVKPYIPKPGRDLYLLFVGIDHNVREKLGMNFMTNYKSIFTHTGNAYFPIQFSPSANPYAYLYYHDSALGDIDRKIVELARTEDNRDWRFNRVRNDRKMEKNYFGNDCRIAELTYSGYFDPINYEDLYHGSSSYFSKTAEDIHVAPNRFKRFVISHLLRDNLSNSAWVIDAAAGRGADLHRYQEIGVKNALFIDIDPTAIAELIRRKFSFMSGRSGHSWLSKKGGLDDADLPAELPVVKDTKTLTVHTLVADLSQPESKLIASVMQYGVSPGVVNGIVCNFALHYLCRDIGTLRNILTFVSRMLVMNGLFVFTVMDGRAVFELLAPYKRGQQWESREGTVLKYGLRKDYESDKMSPTGQNIAVTLPFSEEPIVEPLCNVETVIAESKKLGLELEVDGRMDEMLPAFAKGDRTRFEQLTVEDKKYIGLFRYVSLRKTRDHLKNNEAK